MVNINSILSALHSCGLFASCFQATGLWSAADGSGDLIFRSIASSRWIPTWRPPPPRTCGLFPIESGR